MLIALSQAFRICCAGKSFPHGVEAVQGQPCFQQGSHFSAYLHSLIKLVTAAVPEIKGKLHACR